MMVLENTVISFSEIWFGILTIFILFIIMIFILIIYSFLTLSKVTFQTNMNLIKFIGYLTLFIFAIFYNPHYTFTFSPLDIPWVFHIPNGISMANFFVALLALFEATDNLKQYIRSENRIIQAQSILNKEAVIHLLKEKELTAIADELSQWKNRIGKDTGWVKWFKNTYPVEYNMLKDRLLK